MKVYIMQFHALLMLIVLSWLSVSVCQDVPAGISDSLLVLIQEENTIRARLEQDLAALERDLNTVTLLQNNVSCGCPGEKTPVAFSASLTYDITSLGFEQQIPFDKIITNVGNGYDARHGEFRAPVDGVYQFSVSAYVKGGQWVGLEIVVDDSPAARVRSGDSSDYTMAGTSVTVKLRAGQDVWVQHISESDSNAILGQMFSTFSGYLVQIHA